MVDGGSVDGRLLFVTFGTFVIVHPVLPTLPRDRKIAEKKPWKKEKRERTRSFRACYLWLRLSPHTMGQQRSGESVCPKQTQWKTAWQRFEAGNKTKRTRVPFRQSSRDGAGVVPGDGTPGIPCFGTQFGNFRGSKAEHRNHRSSTRTCRKRLCVFSIVAIVHTQNNRNGRRSGESGHHG